MAASHDVNSEVYSPVFIQLEMERDKYLKRIKMHELHAVMLTVVHNFVDKAIRV